MRRRGWVEEYDFLVIPQPQPDELLSSWLTRTAFAHDYPLTTFISMFLKHDGSALSRIDIDFKEDPILFEKLAHKSRFPIEQIVQMSLRSEEGYLFESDHGLYPPKQIRKLKDKRTHYGLMFCPKCLAEDTHPYWRKQWRYTFNNVCSKHKIFLTDRCGKCYERIRLTKMKPSDELVYCSKCRRDLRLTVIPHVPKLHMFGLKAVTWFIDGLQNGYFDIAGSRIRSLFVFEAYTNLSRLLDRGDNLLLDEFPMLEEYKKLCRNHEEYHSRKASPIYRNFYITTMIYFLFQNYPENIQKFAQDNNLTHRDFVHGFKHISFWYQCMIDELVSMQNKIGREISESEVVGAINYLKNRGEKVTQETVAGIVGCHFTIHKQYVGIYKKTIRQQQKYYIDH
ncbi:hypothetical protein E0765_11835 [Sulfuricurvum sp. IAE1]|uniref:TniQ family protein n=1 Tax=Sulfuricurvum sp. IAE1 TaxID=2546102 RepID=UPI00104700F0|nr:TniQ family protein [Sulfuricurvum sp. IAE1]TDA62494.1 hypothetical protein E0765_11835 [Sulfuricurvum sp. IAE1]